MQILQTDFIYYEPHTCTLSLKPLKLFFQQLHWLLFFHHVIWKITKHKALTPLHPCWRLFWNLMMLCMKQNKQCKQTLKRTQYRPESIFNTFLRSCSIANSFFYWEKKNTTLLILVDHPFQPVSNFVETVDLVDVSKRTLFICVQFKMVDIEQSFQSNQWKKHLEKTWLN